MKRKWSVTGAVEASTYVGEYEAESAEEAIAIAEEDAQVSVCHQCARKIIDPEISELHAEPCDE